MIMLENMYIYFSDYIFSSSKGKDISTTRNLDIFKRDLDMSYFSDYL